MENFADKLKSFGQYLIDNSESLSNEFEKTERFEKSPSVPSFVGKAYMKFVLKNESISKKVNIKEFKSIIKNIIKEEMMKENEVLPKVDTKEKQKVINQLKGIYKYSQQEAEKLVNDHPNMNATKIHNKVKNKS